jgi:hypothetical protein
MITNFDTTVIWREQVHYNTTGVRTVHSRGLLDVAVWRKRPTTSLHSVTAQKTSIWVLTAVKTSKLSSVTNTTQRATEETTNCIWKSTNVPTECANLMPIPNMESNKEHAYISPLCPCLLDAGCLPTVQRSRSSVKSRKNETMGPDQVKG